MTIGRKNKIEEKDYINPLVTLEEIEIKLDHISMGKMVQKWRTASKKP